MLPDCPLSETPLTPFQFSVRDAALPFRHLSNGRVLEPIARKHKQSSSSPRNNNIQIKMTQSEKKLAKHLTIPSYMPVNKAGPRKPNTGWENMIEA